MPSDVIGIADVNGGYEKVWAVADGDTFYSQDFMYSFPPENVGLASIFIDTSDTGGGQPTITPVLQFKYPDGSYGPEHSISDDDGATTFVSGNKFEARLDVQSWWKWHTSWRIKLTRDSSDALKITRMYGATL